LVLGAHFAPALLAAGAHFGFCSDGAALSSYRSGETADLRWAETMMGFAHAVDIARELSRTNSQARVYAVLSPRDLRENDALQAVLRAARDGIDNLIAIVAISEQEPDTAGRIRELDACGCRVLHVDGHDLDAIVDVLEHAFETRGRPAVVAARTVNGSGVPFMQNAEQWGGPVTLSRQEAADALAALGSCRADCTKWLGAISHSSPRRTQ
jgi:transketolase